MFQGIVKLLKLKIIFYFLRWKEKKQRFKA